jgi:oligoendopeptidase F
MMRARICFLILALCGANEAEGPSADVRLSANLERYYFVSPSAEQASRTKLQSSLANLAKMRGKVGLEPQQLLAALRTRDEIRRLVGKHDGYLHLRCALDRTDTTCGDEDKLDADVAAGTAFLDAEILAIPAGRLPSFYESEPALTPYRFAIEKIRRNGKHALPLPQQELLDRLNPEIAGWQFSLYDEVLSQTNFGSVHTPAGELDVTRQRNLIASNPDPRVREQGFKLRYAGLASNRDLLAFALLHTAEAGNELARAQSFPDAPARKYFQLFLKPEDTHRLLDRMAEHGDVVKRFERIRVNDIERDYRVPAGSWDMSGPARGLLLPKFSVSDARAALHEALAPLGPQYQREFDVLIDPASGRADILPGGAPNRCRGGFSVGYSGSTSILFVGNFDGTFKDLSVIVHEGGHAVHRSLMSSHGVAPDYAEGPSFLFESFAEFNELLLADYLAKQASDPALRRYYLEQWINIKGLDAFYGAQDAILEQAVYDGVKAGTLHGPDDLDHLTLNTDSQFSIWPEKEPELRTRWAAVSLAYEDPLYDVNYMYAGLLALKYFQLQSKSPDWFASHYLALLENGFDRPPSELLHDFLGIDLSGDSLLTDDLQLLDERLRALESAPSLKP